MSEPDNTTKDLSGDEDKEKSSQENKTAEEIPTSSSQQPPAPVVSPNRRRRMQSDHGNPVGQWSESSKLRSWFERLEVVFMDLDDENSNDKWKAVKLIKWIGPEGYERLKMLCAPNLPIEEPYTTLKELLLNNVDPEPTVLSQRYTFSRLQQGTLSVSDWEALLKFHAAKCGYGAHYEQAVRDQFIFGLACNETRIKLLELETVTLKNAFSKAEARERAQKDSHVFKRGTTNRAEVHKVNQTRRYPSSSTSTGAKTQYRSGESTQGGKKSIEKKVCARCKLNVKTNHCTEKQCKTSCFHCKKLGHTRTQCRNLGKDFNQHSVNVDESSDCKCETQSLNYIAVNKVSSSSEKVFVNVHVQSKCLKLELDTGSALTCISESLFTKLFPDLVLKPTRQILKVANGSTINKVQMCDVDMSYRQIRHHQVRLYVASDPFPALLGRDWIALIWGQDWSSKLLSQDTFSCTRLAGKDKLAGKGTEGYNKVSVPGCASVVPGDVTDGDHDDHGEYLYRLDQEEVAIRQTVTNDKTESDSFSTDKKSREARLAKLRQSKVFEPGIGEVVGYEAQLELKEDFRKARTVPYALKERIEETIDKMVADKILTPVDHSQFASPIVPVLKPDSTVRICGDYKSTLNINLETKQYPLPTVDECFHPMRGGKQFSKLDIRQAYNHLALREADKKLTTINTTKGLLIWNRLPYGVSSATAIFQQTMDSVLRGCKSTVCRVDDILVTGQTEEEHLDNLEEVIKRLEVANFRCNLKKSEFLKEEVKYLGYLISAEGIRPSVDKVETLMKADYPESLPALISFLSACQYYGRFIKNLSTIVEPLNKLRRGVPWTFGKEEKEAFDALKKALVSSAVVIPYDPKLAVKIDTDASKTGLGAVISHVFEDGTERPIEFVSRTLSIAERNYSQIEKEALSLVWGVTKFHRFVYARRFTLVTDHKPLVYILKENKAIPEMAASRLVRWANTLACYQYKIQYRPTEKHSNADVCSRYPLKIVEDDDTDVADVFFNTFAETPIINFNSVSRLTRLDSVLSKVLKFVLEGWPSRLTKYQEDIRPYFERQTELSTEQGCVLWGSRIIVPEKLREEVLELLHLAHQGVVAVKALARSYVWWPRINDDIEKMTKKCGACQDSQNLPNKSKPHPWKPATRPWERIHVDFCGPVHGVMWLVVVDVYTKWIEVINMKSSTTSSSTIRELRKLFAIHGLPVILCSDNAQQLKSEEIVNFLKSNGIQPVLVPTYSPNTNGIAERAVQTFKRAMEKAGRRNVDYEKNLANWLLHYRNTPNSVTKKSPAMMMFNRPTRTLLSLLDPLTNRPDNLDRYLENGEEKTLRTFQIGERVRIYNVRTDQWYKGNIIGKEGCKVYLVKSLSGNVERRHVDHLVRAVDLDEWPDSVEPCEHENTHVPWHKPSACEPEPDQAVPIINNPEPKTSNIPQPTIDSSLKRPKLVAKQPVVELIRQNPSDSMFGAKSNAAKSTRVSNRLKTNVERYNYSKLGGN